LAIRRGDRRYALIREAPDRISRSARMLARVGRRPWTPQAHGRDAATPTHPGARQKTDIERLRRGLIA
jgi:hypothetical protein